MMLKSVYPILFFFNYPWIFSLHDFFTVFSGVVLFHIFYGDSAYSARIGITSFDLSLVVIIHNFK